MMNRAIASPEELDDSNCTASAVIPSKLPRRRSLAVIAAQFDAVLFDLDATLLDTESALDATIIATLQSLHGVTVSLDFLHTLRGTVDLGPGSWTQRVMEECNLQHQTTDVQLHAAVYSIFDALSGEVDEMPFAGEVVSALADAGVPCAIVTSSTRASVQRKRSIKHETLFASMRAIVTVEDVAPRAKPCPDGYLKAADLLGCDIRRCLIIEDSVPGVLAGVAAGATVVSVPAHIETARAAVVAAGAHAVLESLGGLFSFDPRSCTTSSNEQLGCLAAAALCS